MVIKTADLVITAALLLVITAAIAIVLSGAGKGVIMFIDSLSASWFISL